jgi:hypothetical protein
LWFSCGFLVVFLWFWSWLSRVFLVLFAQFSCMHAFLPAGVILVNKSKILTCFFMRWAPQSKSKLYARKIFRLQQAAVAPPAAP